MNVICRNVSKFAPKFVIERSMKRIFQVFCGLLVAAFSLTSCLNSSDDSTTYYGDMAIKTFTLGTLNRYLHTTTSDGRDSIYKSTYTATSYKLNIDQLNHKIYSADSLLPNTDISRVVCSVTTANNGIVYVKSMISDTLTYFTSGSDSIDFTQPRIFRVYANDGSGSRDYTVSLAVRGQAAGQLLWTEMPVGTELPVTSMNGWEFAFNAEHNGINASNDHWATVIEETLDTDASLLPTENCSFACWKMAKGLSYALLVGDNDSQARAAVVWRKIIDPDKATSWVYMPWDQDNAYYLPKGRHYWLLPYVNGSVLAVDGNGNIYQSRDQGITWKTSSDLKSPILSVAGAAVDDNGILWLQEARTGKVWRGITTK